MRGRLLRWFWADLAQLDTAATEAAGGYDPVFRTTTVSMVGGVRTSGRTETVTRIRCQVTPSQDRAQNAGAAGNLPVSRFELCFHFKDLEKVGLVDANGEAMVRVNDRLAALYDRRGVLAQAFPDPPGLYVTEARSSGFGIGSRRNLLIVTLADRVQGQR